MKQTLRVLIGATQMVAVCLWCFFLGSIFGLVMVIIGLASGIMEGEWDTFFTGVFWCLGQVLPYAFSLLYKRLYGTDKWLKNESFFGV